KQQTWSAVSTRSRPSAGSASRSPRARSTGSSAPPGAAKRTSLAPLPPPLQGKLYGLKGKGLGDQVAEVTELVGLTDAIDRRIQTFSGGMKRRLDLASALLHRPRVLFLDEPTTGLDPLSPALIWDRIRELRERFGATIFLTTQYLEEADELADRVAIIDHGQIVRQGTPAALKAEVGSDVI